MKTLLKTLPLLLLTLCPLAGCSSPETNSTQSRVSFTLSREGVFVNIGFAIIGDFCGWGKVNEELSDEAIRLEWIDNGLYRGTKLFDKSKTIHYKLVEYGDDLLYDRIIEIENIPERVLTINSDDVSVVLRWEQLD